MGWPHPGHNVASPQRSCLGNKTEASPNAKTTPARPPKPQRSCLGNKTEAVKDESEDTEEVFASTKLPR